MLNDLQILRFKGVLPFVDFLKRSLASLNHKGCIFSPQLI